MMNPSVLAIDLQYLSLKDLVLSFRAVYGAKALRAVLVTAVLAGDGFSCEEHQANLAKIRKLVPRVSTHQPQWTLVHSLPNAVLSRCFTFLSEKDLLGCDVICRHWLFLATNSSANGTLAIHYKTSFHHPRNLCRFRNIRRLEVCEEVPVCGTLLRWIASLHRLVHLGWYANYNHESVLLQQKPHYTQMIPFMSTNFQSLRVDLLNKVLWRVLQVIASRVRILQCGIVDQQHVLQELCSFIRKLSQVQIILIENGCFLSLLHLLPNTSQIQKLAVYRRTPLTLGRLPSVIRQTNMTGLKEFHVDFDTNTDESRVRVAEVLDALLEVAPNLSKLSVDCAEYIVDALWNAQNNHPASGVLPVLVVTFNGNKPDVGAFSLSSPRWMSPVRVTTFQLETYFVEVEWEITWPCFSNLQVLGQHNTFFCTFSFECRNNRLFLSFLRENSKTNP